MLLQTQTADPPSTKAGKQVVRSAQSDAMAAEGIGVVVPRHDPYANREMFFPDVASERIDTTPPKFNARQLDQSRPYSEDFTEVGKPPIYARSMRQLWMSTNIPSILAFDGWPPEDGYFAKWIRTNRISVPRGFQTAMVSPVNIDVPQSAAAGSQRTLPGTSPINLSDLYV